MSNFSYGTEVFWGGYVKKEMRGKCSEKQPIIKNLTPKKRCTILNYCLII